MVAQQPIERIRAGSVSCGIWSNPVTVDGKQRTILKASISRRYRDSNNEWRSSQSLSRNEIPLAIYCLQTAFEWMISKTRDDDELSGTGEHPGE